MSAQERPYGWLVKFERRLPNGAGFDIGECRLKGTETAARRAASMKRGFVRVVETDPYTRDQWLRCFGEGKM